jgi:hypothetical protein
MLFFQRALCRPLPAWLSSSLRSVGPWLGLVVLNALFVLPAVLRSLDTEPYLLLQPAGELFVLVTLGVVAVRLEHGIWLRRAAMATGLLLWMYMWDELIGQIIVRQTPLLYDQLFLLRHVGILVSDLWSWSIFGALIGALVGVGLILWLARALLTRICSSFAARPARKIVPVVLGLWGMLIAATVVGPQGGSSERWVQWTTPSLVKNLKASFHMYRSIERGMGASPYAGYESDITLTRKPDVQVFFVESYGRLLWNNDETGARWTKSLEKLGSELEEAGWYAVSGFSEAPVSGGRSWLAEATVLTGIEVRYEAVFRHLLADVSKTPNLVRFLQSQGYAAMLLAPKDRARRGVELENHYAYDRTIYHDDLQYNGRRVGWGEIPDQYSLGFAHENAWSQAEGPIFTNFHMVSSHAPWKVVPRVVKDWHALGNSSRKDDSDMEVSDDDDEAPEQDLGEFVTRMKRYKRQEPKFTYMGEINALKLGSYARSIRYDLAIITDYLHELEGDKIVIIMGDHQPPLIAEDDSSYDVPVHILSRDKALLEEFVAQGFVEGMNINGGRPAVVFHESLFSLIVRNLVRCCAEPGTPLPEVLVDGVQVGSPRRW